MTTERERTELERLADEVARLSAHIATQNGSIGRMSHAIADHEERLRAAEASASRLEQSVAVIVERTDWMRAWAEDADQRHDADAKTLGDLARKHGLQLATLAALVGLLVKQLIP